MLSLGIDVGTTTITAVVFDHIARAALARATLPSRASSAPSNRAAEGWAEIDLARVMAIVAAVVRQVTDAIGGRANDIIRIGLTGQMHGVAFVGRRGQPVRSAITWQDQRTRASIEAFIARAGGVGAFDSMGCVPAAGYLGPTIFWMHQRGELPQCEICTIPDAVGTMLTGGRPRIDPTLAASTGIYDVVHGRWAHDVLERLGLPADALPAVSPAGSDLGRIAPGIASALGVSPQAIVGVALGDHQASLIGSDCTRPGQVHVNIGTGGQVSMVVDAFSTANHVHGLETRPFPRDRFIVTGASLCGGEAFELLRRFFESAIVAFDVAESARPDAQAMYWAMVRAARDVNADADGLHASTRFDGARHRPESRGAFSGLRRANFTLGHMARATLQGVADELGEFYDVMSERHGAGVSLTGSGNAIRHNPLLAEIVSARLGMPLSLPPWEDEAATGAAICSW
jgi:sedoheptulokinase